MPELSQSNFQPGDRVRIGDNMTGVVLGPAEAGWDGNPRLLVAVDGHDWNAQPLVSILTLIRPGGQ